MRLLILITSVCASIVAATALAAPAKHIRVAGRQEVLVTTGQVRLDDIADVSSERVEDDEAVIGLKKIWIATSPEPAQNMTLSAEQVLERIRDQGVDLNQVGYTLPRVITIKRAGRVVSEGEIQIALSEYMAMNSSEVAVKKLLLSSLPSVSPGALNLSIEGERVIDAGRREFQFAALVNGSPEARFSVVAQIDEFREVPVASRTIPRGSVVTETDLVMARFNTAMLPKDAAQKSETILGLEATNDISAGEVFRNTKLAMPILVEAGAKVTMQYKSDLFEASATGIALESGAAGKEIKVRNEESKRIVPGIVTDTGLVRVK